MSLQIRADVSIAAPPAAVWRELTDWEGQGRWIPATTVRVQGHPRSGVGVRVQAFSGIDLGPLPLGLLDNFITTGWVAEQEIEVLHLGPVFTGVGVFRVKDAGLGWSHFTVIEDIELPGKPLERLIGPLVPLLNSGLRFSLRRFRKVTEDAAKLLGPR